MIMMILMTLMTSTCFLFLQHPLSFGLILMIQTILIALMTGLLNYNYWFSYMLFLIMVGGMLVLFMYMTSIASNEKFKLSPKMFFFIMITAIFSFSFMMMDTFLINMDLFTYDLENQEIFMESKKSLNKYFNEPSSMILIMIISYLLITLIMVVKITKIEYGPLRSMI
uniref:NADH-ubiquinone oxidoreductase chain 6 n=1 Tax=Enneaphyllus aeneipennis TaxID=2546605 RepID=A0A6H0N1Y2_9CUCU|nr:NADH dehydrogenase subunit 6 [Enneaphyllus aeneipennis]